uniref:Peroxisomal multifunctional enzyme type 2 n=1 Tax=Lygus hesperus TaxID=30085 RepID=A0A0A9YW71_LYGHE
MKLLHGEAYVEIHKPLPTCGSLKNVSKILDIYDKKKAACVLLEVRSYDDNDELVLYNRSTLFIRGIGGFGGKTGPEPNSELAKSLQGYPIPSNVEPHFQSEFPTLKNQAVLYR